MEALPRIPKGSKEELFPKAESKGGAGVGLNNPEVKLSDCSNAVNCWASACIVGGDLKLVREVHFQQPSRVAIVIISVPTSNKKHCPGEA